jgi:hypothetical protein
MRMGAGEPSAPRAAQLAERLGMKARMPLRTYDVLLALRMLAATLVGTPRPASPGVSDEGVAVHYKIDTHLAQQMRQSADAC